MTSVLSYDEIVERLRIIKGMNYVKTHRAGDAGIGKTLEDLLGITENNVPGPNGEMVELKSARKNTKSMLSLFTKSPDPPKANSILLERFGYPLRHGKGLHTTVNAISYNTLKGRIGFKIDIKQDQIELVSPVGRVFSLLNFVSGKKEEESKEILGYWTKETLKQRFEEKMPRLLYVKADCQGNGTDEEFWYNEAWLLSGFDFDNFLDQLQEGTILVDIRIGQYSDGRPHNHGTGFRVLPDKLDLCFEGRFQIM